ncbi:MAG: enoyl-CoA hydratase/isomerase family protein [Desulfobacterales bacterium]|nr:enoyl-CoA hydratase/isomerase family protein [Desulfobacterales bacterium]MBL7101864.1 enoyl-CoA hydratase/isomerase family protein [Desulfobacteraceae bacterium]MBL7173130.1 enoyl-CoA hydratase/isomerase family protein [Desulfobacteraceae bacterium]
MKKIGIIGAGNMGSGIAQKTAQEGLSVVMVDVKPEFVEKGLDSIRATLGEAVERKILRPEEVEKIMARIQATTDLAETKGCDLVIEAIFEDMDVKKDLFSTLDQVCGPETILATNTSSFSVDELARSTDRPDRFVGLHFFYHPAKNRLLEIIPGPMTSPETVSACRRFAQLTGKTDILVKDAPGFAVNRFFVPWLNEATRILEAGIANIPTIDKVAMETFGIGMGPFKLMNVTGIPIAKHSCESLAGKLGAFYAPSARLKAQFESGELWPLVGEVDDAALEEVADRLLGAVFCVATSLLEKGVTDMTDIDLGAKVGLRWRKGPFEVMNRVGIDTAYAQVATLLKDWPDLTVPVHLENQHKKGVPWDIRYVKYVQDGDLGRVVLSRPDAMNALNETVVKHLDEAFQEAASDHQTQAVILEGAGKAFVAGADIGFFVKCIREGRLDDNFKFTEYGQSVLNRIDESEKLVVAKMDGLAFGGGLELALSADVIVATSKAVMGFPETGIGIYPGLGGTQRTSRYIGKALAKYLIFTGRLIPAEVALSIGLVDYVFAPDEIENKIRSLIADGKMVPKKGRKDEELPPEFQKIKPLFADENIEAWLNGKYLDSEDALTARTAKIIAGKAPLALRFANQIIDAGYEMALSDGVRQELAHLNEIFSTADALTGLTSVGKGRPVFQGK